jgi:ABC-type multidrug transport system ATPase subunit
VRIPLRVIHLTKRYRLQGGGSLEAVSDVSFDVRGGECFGLLGPNGAGKSTAIHCISGFYPPTSGEVFIEDVDVHADPKRARQTLGLCAQEDTLDSDLRVLDQLVRHATFFHVPPEEGARRARAAPALWH